MSKNKGNKNFKLAVLITVCVIISCIFWGRQIFIKVNQKSDSEIFKMDGTNFQTNELYSDELINRLNSESE